MSARDSGESLNFGRPVSASTLAGFFVGLHLPANEFQYTTIFAGNKLILAISGYTFMDKKRPVGRPKLPDEIKRKPKFTMKLTDAEFELIQAASGGNVNGWARGVLLRAAKRVK